MQYTKAHWFWNISSLGYANYVRRKTAKAHYNLVLKETKAASMLDQLRWADRRELENSKRFMHKNSMRCHTRCHDCDCTKAMEEHQSQCDKARSAIYETMDRAQAENTRVLEEAKRDGELNWSDFTHQSGSADYSSSSDSGSSSD